MIGNFFKNTNWIAFRIALFLHLASVTFALAATNLCSVSRHENRVDVFWIDDKGTIWNIGWENGQWGPAIIVAPSGIAEPAGSITVIARNNNSLDLFWTGKGGSIATSSWSTNNPSWTFPKLISGPGTVSIAGGLAVVSTYPERLDVFWIAAKGGVMTNWWDARLNNSFWNTPLMVAAPNTTAPNSAISVVSRLRDHLDVFWTAPNGALVSNWWNASLNGGRWNTPFTIAGPKTSSPTGGISALSRNGNHIEVYWVAPNGAVMESWFNNSWNPAIIISPAGSARTNGTIVAKARRPDHADVFWISPDGSLLSCWWNATVNNAQWNKPFSIAGPNTLGMGNNGLVALNRTAEDLGLFYFSNGQSQLFNPWWASSANNGQWNAPYAVWSKPSRLNTVQATMPISDALLEVMYNTYKAKDGRITKSVRPAAPGEKTKTNATPSGSTQETSENGFVCTAVPVSESQSSFESIVLANPTELFYPGAVIDAKSIANGTYLLQQPTYTPLRLSINLLGGGASGSNTKVVQPAGGRIYRGNVYDGISELLRNTTNVGNAANASIDVRIMESQEELELFLGGSFSGWGASISANMGMSKQQKRNVIYVKYVQKDFSVIVDSPPSELFPQHTFGQYPNWCMVQKVNYGRMAIVRFESDFSAEELGASISASYGGFGFGAKAVFNINTKKVLAETNASAVFIGGDPALAGEAIGSLLGKSASEILDKVKSYIVNGAYSNKNISVTPISYELVFLDGSKAMIQTNTNYVNRECKPLAREVEFTFEGLIAYDDLYDRFNQGNSGYNFYTGYQNDRSHPLVLSVYYTDAPRSRNVAKLVGSQVLWNANADQPILVLSSATNTFKPELRKPFEEIKGAPPRLTPFGDPKRGGGIFLPKIRIPLDPEMLRNDQVLFRLEGQVSREMTFDDEAMYLSPATASEYLLSDIFQRRFTLEYKHNNSEHRAFLQFFVQPLY